MGIFYNSCGEIFNSKAFVDTATAGRFRGLSTIYIKHKLFDQGKQGQSTHIVLFSSPCDMMPISTLRAHLRNGSELVDRHQDASSVRYGHLLIGLSPRTCDQLRFCKTQDLFPQSFISRIGWNNQQFWSMKSQNFSFFQIFQSFSHNCKNRFLQFFPKKFIRFFCVGIVNLLKESLESLKRHHVTESQNEVPLPSLKRIT